MLSGPAIRGDRLRTVVDAMPRCCRSGAITELQLYRAGCMTFGTLLGLLRFAPLRTGKDGGH